MKEKFDSHPCKLKEKVFYDGVVEIDWQGPVLSVRTGACAQSEMRRECSGKKISYFGLARNLIRHLISPNQDDLSYSSRAFFTIFTRPLRSGRIWNKVNFLSGV